MTTSRVRQPSGGSRGNRYRRPGRSDRTRSWVGALVVGVIATAHAANDALMAALGVLLPHLQRTFDASPLALAALVTTLVVSASAFQPVLGSFGMRVDARAVLAAGIAVAAVSWSLIGVAGSLWALVALIALGGVGSAAFHPLAMTMIGGPAAHRHSGAGALGAFTAAGLLGFALGPVMVQAYVEAFGLRHMYWLMIPGLGLAVLLWWTLPSDWLPATPGRRVRWRAAATGPVGRLLVASTLQHLVLLVYLSAVPLWLTDARGLPTDSPWLGWVLGTFTLAAGAGALAGGILGDRWGYRRTAVLSLTGSSAPLVAMLMVAPGPLMLAAATVAGLLLNMTHPLLVARAQTEAPQAPAAAAGIVVGVAAAVAGVLYLALGATQTVLGYEVTLWVAVATLLPAILATWHALAPPVTRATVRAQPADLLAKPRATFDEAA